MTGAREILYVDGRFLEPGERATVDLRDRGFLLGDSVFETVRACGGAAFALDRHLSRLGEAADALGIPMPHTDLHAVTAAALTALAEPDVTLRYTLTRGAGAWGVGMAGPFTPSLSLIARASTPHAPERYTDGVDVKVVTTRRVPAACLPTRFKTGNYLGTVLARRELEAEGLVEGIQLTVDGRVSSGTVSNVFAVIDGELCTPSLDCDCRAGITRELVLELAPRLGIVTRETHLTLADLARAHEVFFTSALMDALPARSVHDVAEYGPAHVARRVREALRAERGDSPDAARDGATPR